MKLLELQVSTWPIPIGMRAMDLEDELGIELDEEGNDSVEEEEEELQGAGNSESAMEDPSDWLMNRFVDDSDTTLHLEPAIQLGDTSIDASLNPDASFDLSSDSN